MNKGTIIRTILAIASVINSGAIATGVAEFENPTVNAIYKILSFCATAVILFINTWYDNNYTEEACIGTGITRQLKKERKDDYKGEIFFDEVDEAETDEGDEGDEDE
jgi:SPP1 family holin